MPPSKFRRMVKDTHPYTMYTCMWVVPYLYIHICINLIALLLKLYTHVCVEFCRHCPQNLNTFELSPHQVGLEIILAEILRKYGKCGYMYFTGQGLAHTHTYMHTYVRSKLHTHTHTHTHKLRCWYVQYTYNNDVDLEMRRIMDQCIDSCKYSPTSIIQTLLASSKI